jgi:hypothetical protein
MTVLAYDHTKTKTRENSCAESGTFYNTGYIMHNQERIFDQLLEFEGRMDPQAQAARAAAAANSATSSAEVAGAAAEITNAAQPILMKLEQIMEQQNKLELRMLAIENKSFNVCCVVQ